mmetsp:Transcript_2369/g.3274  ORF Transcript_2369/g.3274 Transcript_2369/m.3274 type:complete len:262 (-) Transcript_2369:157-942(-)
MMRPEEDMLCANLGSNHACNSPSALKMAHRFQKRDLVTEFNFNMHRNGDPAMPTDVCLKLDEIAKKGGGIKGWQESSEGRAFDSHIARGFSLLEMRNVSGARSEFGYAAAIAYIDGDAEKRVQAYTKLAQAYLQIDFDSDLDLSGAMHMFWRILRERSNTTMLLNQAQLLGQYSGVPKVSIIATLLRQSLHQMSREGSEGNRPFDVHAAAMGYYKLEDLLRVSGRHGEADALPMELSDIHKAVSADPELKKLAHTSLRLLT